MSLPQAGLHAGGEAAGAMMLGPYPRQIDELGQRIVVNMQACIVWTLMNEQAMPFLHGNHLSRTGIFVGSVDARRKMVYECKDGHISILIAGGMTFGNSTKALIEWMRESEIGSDWMRTKDWVSWVPGVFMKLTEQDHFEINDLETTIQRFMLTMTKHEIYTQGLKRRIFLAPVANVADVAADDQLNARDFWTQVPHDTIRRTLTFPGPFAKMSATPIGSSTGVAPIAPKYSADNGADVIRFESAARPDVLRIGPPWKDAMPGINRSQFFASFNTSKKGITLDLSKPKAREIAKRLVPWADIIVESFTPKAMRNWGLDYENLRERRPDLIMLSTCMQGQTGPNALYPGFGQLMAALSGFYYISGYGPGSFAPPYGAYTDFIAPRFSAFALLAALDYRRRTGKGQYIDMSQYECAIQNLAPALIDYHASGRVLEPRGNTSEPYAPHGAYRCADEAGNERWIAIAVANAEQWRAHPTALSSDSPPPPFKTAAALVHKRAAI